MLHKHLKGKNYSDIVIKHAKKQHQQKKLTNENRATKYIGISLSSQGKWQVIFKYKGKMVYLGSYLDLGTAVLVYDMVTIQLKGIAAKTNYDYNKAQVMSMLLQPCLITVYRGLPPQ